MKEKIKVKIEPLKEEFFNKAWARFDNLIKPKKVLEGLRKWQQGW